MSAFGSMIGALFSGPVAKIGRWKCLLFTNFFVIIGSILALSPQLYIFYFGRFLYGLAAGCYAVFCPLYINETAPIEIKGSLGAITQLTVVFGLMIPFVLGYI